jgi:hypothetical protein
MQTLTPPRHWLRRIPVRLSLRTLMLLVLVAGAGFGWLGMRARREARRQWVIATIQASGATVGYDGVGISTILWRTGSSNSSPLHQHPLTAEQLAALGSCDRLRVLVMVGDGMTDAAVAYISALTNLQHIEFRDTKINGAGLVHLAGMRRLRWLSLTGSDLDDAGLANLASLTSLRTLRISGGKYTDAGLASLSGLTGLTQLELGSESCTDAGLANLAGLMNVRFLHLTGPQVSDAWLDRLATMEALRQVDISGAQVSDAAIERLYRALPEVLITENGKLR